MYTLNYTDLIGVPFVNRGRDKTKGLDCYGLVQEMYKKCGVEIAEYYADFNDAEKIQDLIISHTQGYPWKRIEKPEIPCLVTFRFGSEYVNHTAIYIGNNKFLHTRSKVGVCVDRIDNPAWKRVIEGFYRYVGEQ